MEQKKFEGSRQQAAASAFSGIKIAENLIAFEEYPNGWSFRRYADGAHGLYDCRGNLVSSIPEDDDDCYAAGNLYWLKEQDAFVLYASDGKKVAQSAAEITLLPNGWCILQNGSANALYRPDMSLAAQNFCRAHVLADGSYYLTQDENELWTLYARNGKKLEQQIVSSQFYSPDYYMLSFDGKNVIYDVASGREYVNDYSLVKLLPCKMYTAVANRSFSLYRADGMPVLSGYDKYVVFKNGMYFAANNGEFGTVFYPDGKVAVSDVWEYEEIDSCSQVWVEDENNCQMFNSLAEISHVSSHNVQIYPNGWYLCGDSSLYCSRILCRADNSIVQKDLLDADVFINGWYITERPNLTDGKAVVYTLHDAEGIVIAQSLRPIVVLEDYDAYLLENADGSTDLYEEGGGKLCADVRCLYASGTTILAVRKGENHAAAFRKPQAKEISRPAQWKNDYQPPVIGLSVPPFDLLWQSGNDKNNSGWGGIC